MMNLNIKNFYRNWCLICKLNNWRLKGLEKEFEQIGFDYINVKEDDSEVEKYDIESAPTILILWDDEIIYRLKGSNSKEKIRNCIYEAKEEFNVSN